MEDVRKDWFMQQHFTTEQLETLYQWEMKSGKVGKVVPAEEGFCLYHVEDTKLEISLCFMKEERELRRWTERLAYKTNDGKTAKQFEEETGYKEEPVIIGKEVYRKDRTTLTMYGEKKMHIVSGDYALVAKRTASNAYEILLLNNEEYAKHLEDEQTKLKK